MKNIVKIVVILVVIAILGGIGYAFIGNNFAMVTIFSQDEEKCLTIINKSIERHNESKYHVFTYKQTVKNEEGVELSVVDTTFSFYVDGDDYGMAITGKNKVYDETTEDYTENTLDGYSKEGVAY